jgi:hypothetical protein
MERTPMPATISQMADGLAGWPLATGLEMKV